MSDEAEAAGLRDILAGYSSIGFRVEPDVDQLTRLMEGAAVASTSYPSVQGETLLYSDDNLRFWQRLEPEGFMPVLEGFVMAGMVGFCPEVQSGPKVIAYLVDREDQSESTPIPVCFASPHHLLGTPPPVDELVPLNLSLLAQTCLIFETAEELAAHPKVEGWPAKAFAPTGVIDIESNEMRAEPTTHAFLTGHVILSGMETNSLTASHFWSLRVRTQYGEVTVCLPVEACDTDPMGKIIAVNGRMSGSVPHIIQDPLPEEAAEAGPPLDNELVERRLRELLTDYVLGPDFEMMFYNIHPSKIAQRLASGVGLFNKEVRSAAKSLDETRQLAKPELRERYQSVIPTAPIVFARIVMANTMALEEGQSSPALVVLAWGDRAEEVMTTVRDTLARIHFDMPENDLERQLAAEIADEEYVFGRRRRMPDWLTGGEECYAADLWLSSEALDNERLRMEVVLCAAEPGPNGLTMALPGKIINQVLSEGRSPATPPPIPSSGSGATPPPIPPKRN